MVLTQQWVCIATHITSVDTCISQNLILLKKDLNLKRQFSNHAGNGS